MVDATLLAIDFSLGVATFFSPCGYPMLPAYIAYYLPREADAAPLPFWRAALRGLGGGLLAALGVLLVLSIVALAAFALGAPFKARVVHLELVGGLLVMTLGVLTLAGRAPSMRFSLRPSTRRGALGLVSFGALYAIVAAGCVAPILLGVAFEAATLPPVDGALAMAAYASGIGALLVIVTMLVTTAQHRALALIKQVLPHVQKASGVALLFVGAYLVYYWARVVWL